MTEIFLFRGGDKARLVMQYIAYHGPLAKEDKQALGLDQVGFSAADMQAFSNLNYITANKDVVRALFFFLWWGCRSHYNDKKYLF